MTPSRNAEELVLKKLCSEGLYEEYALNESFIKVHDLVIRHSMREYWEGKKNSILNDLAFHATSWIRLQRHDVTSKQTSPTTNEPQMYRDNPC